MMNTARFGLSSTLNAPPSVIFSEVVQAVLKAIHDSETPGTRLNLTSW